MSPEQIVENVGYMLPRHFVITGGEPCAQDIWLLTAKLLMLGSVQVETSGTHHINVAPGAWVTVSPKVDMAGGLEVLQEALERANEIKMPVADQGDLDNLLNLLQGVKGNPVVWLQPVSQGEQATALCVEACLKHHWRLSIQTHKYVGVR
jgi:7-carboxy-7-deazaguanine synthase